MAKTFTGADFIKALSEGTLKEPIVREGMAKFSDNDPTALHFSEGTGCTSWTRGAHLGY